MGTGHAITCKKCGTEYSIMTGIGFMFPTVYKETVDKIRSGEFGEELKELFLNDNGLAVDCEEDLFVCKCGHWKTEINLDVYEPLNEDIRKRYTNDLGNMFAMRYELKHDFKQVRHQKHICDKCGKEMKQIKYPDSYVRRYGLSCPECGEKNTADPRGMIFWD